MCVREIFQKCPKPACCISDERISPSAHHNFLQVSYSLRALELLSWFKLCVRSSSTRHAQIARVKWWRETSFPLFLPRISVLPLCQGLSCGQALWSGHLTLLPSTLIPSFYLRLGCLFEEISHVTWPLLWCRVQNLFFLLEGWAREACEETGSWSYHDINNWFEVTSRGQEEETPTKTLLQGSP